MNFADYIVIPLELIVWVLCGLVKKEMRKRSWDTSYIPYIAMAISTVLAIAMHYTSDLIGGDNIWDVIVIGIANGLVAVGINESSKLTKDSSGNEVTVVSTSSPDELWEINIAEAEKDAGEETIDGYSEEVEEVSVGTEDEVDSEEANG